MPYCQQYCSQNKRRIRIRKRSVPREESINRSLISDEIINEFITSILLDPEINIRLLPDSLERRAYQTLIYTMMKVLRDIIDKVELRILGHKITLSINPDKIDDSKVI